uniref:Uncharacterized protein n=1 Tax=Mycena chlorophos TaxID=658473 RepID=A0ABQ0L437_MYCCL|nr:predicted protein [Mycena chlorophos]
MLETMNRLPRIPAPRTHRVYRLIPSTAGLSLASTLTTKHPSAVGVSWRSSEAATSGLRLSGLSPCGGYTTLAARRRIPFPTVSLEDPLILILVHPMLRPHFLSCVPVVGLVTVLSRRYRVYSSMRPVA